MAGETLGHPYSKCQCVKAVANGLGDAAYGMRYFCLSEGTVHNVTNAHVTSNGGSSPQALSPSPGGSSTPLPYLRIYEYANKRGGHVG